jgi:hypothetical protein
MTRDVGRDVDFRWLVYGFLVSFLCNAYYFKPCPWSYVHPHLYICTHLYRCCLTKIEIHITHW